MKKVLSWHYEHIAKQEGYHLVAGVDEAGRGCLAGPVVAGAVIFKDESASPEKINDSKKLSRVVRKKLFEEITNHESVLWGVGVASVEEIDQINILKAAHLAMKRAISNLTPSPDFILIDGLRVESLGDYQQPIVGGDAVSPSIAAASIVAKEYRDRLMEELAEQYPQYGLEKHKGYGTAAHINAIQTHGVTPIHRRSFAPVRQCSFTF